MCVYSLASIVSKTVRLKKKKTKTQRVSSRLHHAKYINISIWCLIFPPLTLTPLALLPPSLSLTGPFQDKVMLLAYVMNLPPDPKGACGELAHQQAGRVAIVTLKQQTVRKQRWTVQSGSHMHTQTHTI